MPKAPFTYKTPQYCRVHLVKELELPAADPCESPKKIASLIWPLISHSPTECVFSVVIDARRRPIAIVKIADGSLTQCLAQPREVFTPVLLAFGAAVVLIHNHPSGDPTPSLEDRKLTQALRQAAETLAIPMLDHIIVGAAPSFYSFAENGWA